MAESPLWVVVDDTSPEIQYRGGQWFSDVGTFDSSGSFGAPYGSTLHGTNKSASFSFSFRGTAAMVAGTMLLRETPDGFDPTWECYVDNVSIGANPLLGNWTENNKNLCGPTNSFADGQHTLTVNVTSKTGQTFWFDNIQYIPSDNEDKAALGNRLVKLNADYPEFDYGPGWANLNDHNLRMTSREGTQFDYEFEGISLEWYGAFPGGSSGNASKASYTIDDQAAVPFKLPRHSANTTSTIYHTKFFESPKLPMGKHRLSVTYNGDVDKTPLVLFYLVVQTATATSPSSPSSPSSMIPTPTSFGSELPPQTNGARKIGPLVGGIVGGLIFFCILGSILFFIRRRRRRRASNHRPPTVTQKFEQLPHTTSSFLLASSTPSTAHTPSDLSTSHSLQASSADASGSHRSPRSRNDRHRALYHVTNASVAGSSLYAPPASTPGFGISSKEILLEPRQAGVSRRQSGTSDLPPQYSS